jgi:hypothetical protein
LEKDPLFYNNWRRTYNYFIISGEGPFFMGSLDLLIFQTEIQDVAICIQDSKSIMKRGICEKYQS